MSKGLALRRGIRCGIDTGGTFTDLIGVDDATGDLIIGKFPSSPRDSIKSLVGVIRAGRGQYGEERNMSADTNLDRRQFVCSTLAAGGALGIPTDSSIR